MKDLGHTTRPWLLIQAPQIELRRIQQKPQTRLRKQGRYSHRHVRESIKHLRPVGVTDGNRQVWDCQPGVVWVWEVKPKGKGNSGENKAQAALGGHIATAERGPRAKGKRVIRGPNSAFNPPVESMPNIADPYYEEVTVENGDTPGVQLYERKRRGEKAKKPEIQKMNDVMEVRSDAEDETRRYLRVLTHPKDPGAVRSDPVGDGVMMGVIVVGVLGVGACIFTPVCAAGGAATGAATGVKGDYGLAG